MAQNTPFTVGQILTAAQMNKEPFGKCDWATSNADYTLTTSLVIATGMTVTWTADSTRLYQITYYEPQVKTSTVLSAYVDLEIRNASASGTQLQQIFVQNPAAVSTTTTGTLIYIVGGLTGSTTMVGCALTSSTTGTPKLVRSSTARAYMLVEDIGPV